MTDEKKCDIFVSYSKKDNQWVEKALLPALDSGGISYCLEWDFSLGKGKLDEFTRAVTESTRTLLVISKAFLEDNEKDRFSEISATIALRAGERPVIPLLFEVVDKFPPELEGIERLDLTTGDPAREIERLVKQLKLLKANAASSDGLPDCPYPGLKPYSAEEADLFFGRNDVIRALRTKVEAQRLTIIIGPSGCGKTSLVFAGLLPALQRSSQWSSREAVLATDPLRGLAEALRIAPDEADTPVDWVALASQGLLQSGSNLLLVVDHVEALFTRNVPRDAQNKFIMILKEILNNTSEGIKILLVLRADFFADLMESEFWTSMEVSDASKRFDVSSIDGENLREIIEEPAKRIGVEIEPQLVERLLSDADGAPGILPMLQVTMEELWKEIQATNERLLSLSAYERLFDGDSGLLSAISAKADRVIAEVLTAEQRPVAMRILLRLVQFGDGNADTRRQQVKSRLRVVDENEDLFEQTLSVLIENSLLTSDKRLISCPDGDKAVAVIDLAHEALIIGWQKLSGWLKEYRDAELAQRRLEGKAEDWVRLGRGNGGLLDEAEFAEATAWMHGPQAAELKYSEDFAKLIMSSREWLIRQKIYQTIPELRGILPTEEIRQNRRVFTFRRATESPWLAIVRVFVDGDGTSILRVVACCEELPNSGGSVATDPASLSVGIAALSTSPSPAPVPSPASTVAAPHDARPTPPQTI
jgi:hypothetical protein